MTEDSDLPQNEFMIDFLSIAKGKDVLERCEEISREFGYVYRNVPSVDVFAERESEFQEVTFILISADDVKVESEIAGMVQVVKQMVPEAYVLVLIDSKLDPSAAVFVKKSGANVVLLANEIKMTSKLEFIASQKIKSSFLPVKVNEMVVDTAIDCALYHLMPLNRKFLPVIRAREKITPERLEKLKSVGEVYVRRDDVEIYQKYANQFEDKSATGLTRRCRAQFLTLLKAYVDLILLISDQSEHASFKEGASLYEKCEQLSGQLMTTLGSVGNAWDVINNSAIGEFGSLERSPAIAAYAGLLSLHGQVGDPTKVMTAVLIADLAMLDLSPQMTRKLRRGESIETLHAEDRQAFQNHPVSSLNKALSRKLQIPDEVKNIILCSHERVDQKGFPSRPRADKIPQESMLIQISEMIDRASLIRLGQTRPQICDIKKQIFEEQAKEGKAFSLLFLEKIRGPLNSL